MGAPSPVCGMGQPDGPLIRPPAAATFPKGEGFGSVGYRICPCDVRCEHNSPGISRLPHRPAGPVLGLLTCLPKREPFTFPPFLHKMGGEEECLWSTI